MIINILMKQWIAFILIAYTNFIQRILQTSNLGVKYASIGMKIFHIYLYGCIQGKPQIITYNYSGGLSGSPRPKIIPHLELFRKQNKVFQNIIKLKISKQTYLDLQWALIPMASILLRRMQKEIGDTQTGEESNVKIGRGRDGVKLPQAKASKQSILSLQISEGK